MASRAFLRRSLFLVGIALGLIVASSCEKKNAASAPPPGPANATATPALHFTPMPNPPTPTLPPGAPTRPPDIPN